MADSSGPTLVTEGLVLYLDASNHMSYPGTGTIWYDLSGNKNHMDLFSTSFSSDAGGSIQVNGSTSSYGDVVLDMSALDYTMITSARYNSGLNARIVNAMSNNWLLGHHATYVNRYYALGWVANESLIAADDTWRIYAGTGNISGDKYSFYINGQNQIRDNAGGSAGPNGVRIGKSYTSTEPSNGLVNFIMLYNRVLTDSEILQNYNAIKHRFI